jgi:hypothetical protein
MEIECQLRGFFAPKRGQDLTLGGHNIRAALRRELESPTPTGAGSGAKAALISISAVR